MKNDINRKFHEVTHKLHRSYLGHDMKSKMDPNRGQGRILKLLQNTNEISQKELGFILDVRGQSLGESLVKLESQELITRTPSEEDKRKMIVSITEAGKEFEFPKPKSPFDILTEEEQVKMVEMLEKVSTNIDENFALKEMDERHHRGHHHYSHSHHKGHRHNGPHSHDGEGRGRHHYPKYNRF